MDMSTSISYCADVCVSINRPWSIYKSVGVLVQGTKDPLVLSALHCFQEHCVVGSVFTAGLASPELIIELEVVSYDVTLDIIVFRTISDLGHRRTSELEFDPGNAVIGKAYIMIGISSTNNVDASGCWNLTWSVQAGMISTALTEQFRIKGSSGCVPGDSGGPIFSPITRRLIGINVAMSTVNPNFVEPAILRPSSESLISPVYLMSLAFRDMFARGGGPAYKLGSQSAVCAEPSIAMTNPGAAVVARPNYVLCGGVDLWRNFAEEIEGMDKILDPYVIN